MKKALKVVGVLATGVFAAIIGIMIVFIASIKEEDQWFDEWNSKY